MLHFFLFPLLLRNPNLPYYSFKKKNSTLQKMLISTMSTNKSLPAFCSHSYQFTADHVGSSFPLLHSCLSFLFTFFLTVPCGMWDIFTTWDRTRASCIGRVKSSPLDNQGSHSLLNVDFYFLWQRHSSLGLSSLGSLLIIKKC